MGKAEYLEKEAKEWVEDFFGEEKDPNREIEEMWGWIEDDYEESPPISEEEFEKLAFAVKAALINGTDIPAMPGVFTIDSMRQCIAIVSTEFAFAFRAV